MKKTFKTGDRVRTQKSGDGIVITSEIRKTRPFSYLCKATGEWTEEEVVTIKLDIPHERTGRTRIIVLSYPQYKFKKL